MKDAHAAEHWMLVEGGRDHRPDVPYASRFESLGLQLPERRLTTRELLASATHHPRIDLEALTGIRERRVCSPGEDSFTLAVAAARDCLAHSRHRPEDIEMLISASISKYKGGLRHQFEPPLSLAIKREIGAQAATSFDLSNACAGMLSSVFVLNDFIRRGVIRCGMVVSGEYISSLDRNAARQVRSIWSKQLASLTLGDAGVAAILERAPDGNPGITFAGFTTLAEHSRLCLGGPAKVGPGAAMFTKARTIHRVAMEDSPPLLADALEETGLSLADIDYLIVHQTSERAIHKGAREFAARFGVSPKHVVANVAERGNTASTTHFVALYEYLEAGRFKPGDEILLLSLASGLEVGVVIFRMDELVDHYGHAH
ncbi:MAG TPA: 3-oxoacyl-[acyl-carrier-protein] synthase III C-terminal domain-containing protein [Myxococcota bacterium]|jgi:3-oxoacyl-[acyl-carrier-protein] synthase-3|nr:3-oxoacyl-[acyl-carrier-protein] synthase III C-terminal domain-containing protein [Myxococcota bacterium]